MATGLSGADMLRFAGSLVLVLGLLAALLWTLRRMQSGVRPGSKVKQMQVVEVMSIGPRQKMILVRVGQHEILAGVTPSQITTLGSWPSQATSLEDGHAS